MFQDHGHRGLGHHSLVYVALARAKSQNSCALDVEGDEWGHGVVLMNIGSPSRASIGQKRKTDTLEVPDPTYILKFRLLSPRLGS